MTRRLATNKSMSYPATATKIEEVLAAFLPKNRAILASLDWSPRPAAFVEGRAYQVWAAAVPDNHTAWELRRRNRDLMRSRGFRAVRDFAGGWWLELWVKDESADADAASTKIGSDLVVPNPSGRAYYPFQIAGIEFLASRPAALLADEMGLGKSIEVAGLLNFLGPAAGRVLIIAPASMKAIWAQELYQWLVDPTVSVAVVNGPTRPAELPAHGVWIINYELLVKFERILHSVVWDIICLDEAHYIKSRASQRTRACFKLSAHAKRKILLSGTPLTNRPAELWPLLHFLSPAEWPSFYRFAHRYCAPFRSEWGWDFSGASHLDELNRRLRSGLMLRRLKKDVLPQLPPLTRSLVPLDVGLGDLESLTRAAGLDPLKMPFEVDPLSIPFDCVAKIRHELGRLKAGPALQFIREQAQDYGEKFVVFAHHLAVLRELAEGLEGSVLMTGETSQVERTAVIEKFQTDSETRFFVGSIRAAGIGLTLTAATRVIFVEGDWVPAIMRQAEDRLGRIGQRNAVLSQWLVVPDSIDVNIMRSVVSKIEVIDAVVEGNSS
jgi:SNF2 family DNA or RNA helicase